MSRLSEATQSVPLCTLCIVIICTLVHAIFFLFEPPLSNFSILARNVLYLGEWYRIVTSAFCHVGIMHIGFNMLSTLAIGGGLEPDLGTLGMLFMIIWSVIITGILYCFGQWCLAFGPFAAPGSPQQHLTQQAVGFSGVIFTMAVMETSRSSEPYRSVMGFIQVPTKLYPWVLMAILQIMMQEISFISHLSGAVVGLMHAYGLTACLLPSNALLRDMETWPGIRWIAASCPNYKPAPPPPPLGQSEPSTRPPSVRVMAQGVVGGVRYMCVAVWWVISAVLQIFGLYSPSAAASSSSSSNGAGASGSSAAHRDRWGGSSDVEAGSLRR